MICASSFEYLFIFSFAYVDFWWGFAEISHEDSTGHAHTMADGDVQWLTAGSGLTVAKVEWKQCGKRGRLNQGKGKREEGTWGHLNQGNGRSLEQNERGGCRLYTLAPYTRKIFQQNILVNFSAPAYIFFNSTLFGGQ